MRAKRKAPTFLVIALIVNLLPPFAVAGSDNENDSPFDSLTKASPNDRSFIVGGKAAKTGRYPFMASVQASRYGGALACGGSLIAPDVVLCAAHCDGQFAKYVQLGKHWRYDYTDESFRIVERVIHPDFDRGSLMNDISLYKLEGSSRFPPVRLDRSNDRIFLTPNDEMTVIGWGQTEFKGYLSAQLLETTIDYMANAYCIRKYGDIYDPKRKGSFDKDTQICGLSPGNDACDGDSGGPLFLKGEDPYEDIQMGIVSWGIRCGGGQFPGIYTRISAYYDWISAHVCRLSAHGCFPELVIFGHTTVPTEPLIDVALRAQVSASSYMVGHQRPKHAVDGSPFTQWSSKREGNDAWIKILFGKPVLLEYFGFKAKLRKPDFVKSFSLSFDDGSRQKCKADDSPESMLQFQYFQIDPVRTTSVLFRVEDGAVNSGASMLSAFVSAPPTIHGNSTKPPDLGQSVAVEGLRATVTASSYFHNKPGFAPENAIDERNHEAQWASWSEKEAAWMEIKLGAHFELRHFAYRSRPGVFNEGRRFLLSFSDGSSRLCLMDTSEMGSLQYFDLGSVVSDHIRFKVVDGDINVGAMQMLAFTTQPKIKLGNPMVPVGLGPDLALQKPVIASSHFQNAARFKPEHAVDGRRKTEWASWGDGNNAWIHIDLQDKYKVNYVAFQGRQAAIDATHKLIMMFSDGSIQIGQLTWALPQGAARMRRPAPSGFKLPHKIKPTQTKKTTTTGYPTTIEPIQKGSTTATGPIQTGSLNATKHVDRMGSSKATELGQVWSSNSTEAGLMESSNSTEAGLMESSNTTERVHTGSLNGTEPVHTGSLNATEPVHAASSNLAEPIFTDNSKVAENKNSKSENSNKEDPAQLVNPDLFPLQYFDVGGVLTTFIRLKVDVGGVNCGALRISAYGSRQ